MVGLALSLGFGGVLGQPQLACILEAVSSMQLSSSACLHFVVIACPIRWVACLQRGDGAA